MSNLLVYPEFFNEREDIKIYKLTHGPIGEKVDFETIKNRIIKELSDIINSLNRETTSKITILTPLKVASFYFGYLYNEENSFLVKNIKKKFGKDYRISVKIGDCYINNFCSLLICIKKPYKLVINDRSKYIKIL